MQKSNTFKMCRLYRESPQPSNGEEWVEGKVGIKHMLSVEKVFLGNSLQFQSTLEENHKMGFDYNKMKPKLCFHGFSLK